MIFPISGTHFTKIRVVFQGSVEYLPRGEPKSVVFVVSDPLLSLLSVSIWLFLTPSTFYWGKKLTSGHFW